LGGELCRCMRYRTTCSLSQVRRRCREFLGIIYLADGSATDQRCKLIPAFDATNGKWFAKKPETSGERP